MIFNCRYNRISVLNNTILATKKLICFGIVAGIAISNQVRGDLVNKGFEDPDSGPLPSVVFIDQSFVPAWKTNAASGLIEIWAGNFNGISAYEGKQHVELNSDEASTLYQEVSGIGAGLTVGFEFAHRARLGTDVMRLTITDLGSDNSFGGGNDSVLFTNTYSATTLNWNLNTSIGETPIVALGNNVLFAYEAVSTGSGDLTQGNFIDAASFGVGVAVPEPSTTTFILGLVGLGACLRRRRTITLTTVADQLGS